MAGISNPTSTLVDDIAGVADLVDSVSQASTNPPSIFIDLEGTKLSREGTISILTLLIRHPYSQEHDVYIVDILCLRSLAFSTPGTNLNGTTLKDILESPAIPKVFFDVRNDSDALYFHYDIALQGIEDVQLMENASRPLARPKTYLNGLARCVKFDAGLSRQAREAWERAKETGERLFRPTMGGSYEVFNQRPLSAAIQAYCAADVRCLPTLRNLYWSKFTAEGKRRVEAETKRRVLESQSASYQPNGPHKALAPDWSKRA